MNTAYRLMDWFVNFVIWNFVSKAHHRGFHVVPLMRLTWRITQYLIEHDYLCQRCQEPLSEYGCSWCDEYYFERAAIAMGLAEDWADNALIDAPIKQGVFERAASAIKYVTEEEMWGTGVAEYNTPVTEVHDTGLSPAFNRVSDDGFDIDIHIPHANLLFDDGQHNYPINQAEEERQLRKYQGIATVLHMTWWAHGDGYIAAEYDDGYGAFSSGTLVEKAFVVRKNHSAEVRFSVSADIITMRSLSPNLDDNLRRYLKIIAEYNSCVLDTDPESIVIEDVLNPEHGYIEYMVITCKMLNEIPF